MIVRGLLPVLSQVICGPSCQKIMPRLLLDIVLVRQPPPSPIPPICVGDGARGGRRGRAGDVAIGLVGLSPGVGVAVVAWLLVAGAGVLALQSPGSEKRTLSRPGSVLKVRLQQKPI